MLTQIKLNNGKIYYARPKKYGFLVSTERLINNTSKTIKFYKKNGFNNIKDVENYIIRYF